MKTAVLLMSKPDPIRLEGKNYTITDAVYSYTGLLSKFKIGGEKYSYTNTLKVKDKVKTGYCKDLIIEQYRNSEINSTDFLDKTNWFDDTFEKAEIGDLFEIEKVDFYDIDGNRNFTNYYNVVLYKFKITKLDIVFNNSSTYPVVDGNIDSPNYSVRNFLNKNKNNSTTGRFYKKNFGDKVAGLQTANVPEAQIERMAYYMVNICFNLYWILEKEIPKKIAIKEIDFIKTAIHNNYIYYADDQSNASNTYNSLRLVDKLIGELLKDWGDAYINDIYSGVFAKDFFPVLDIDSLARYNNSLTNFFNFLTLAHEDKLFLYDSNGFPLNKYGIPLTLSATLKEEKDSERRINFLINLLPSMAFSLFSPEDRLMLLDKVLDYEEIYEDKTQLIPTFTLYDIDALEDPTIFVEDEVVRLVNSFDNTYAEANLLMEFLLQTKNFDGNSSITKFERLYNLIDDKRLDNIFIAGWFTDEENNRAKLIFSLFEIWKKSKYYFYSQPPGIPLAPNGTNPENYFLYTTAGNNYYAKFDDQGNKISGAEPILEFSKYDLSNTNEFSSMEFKYIVEKKLEKEKVKINAEFNLNPWYYDWVPVGQLSSESHYGDYHLYQTITLIGYKLDEDLAAAAPSLQMSFIPAFLFYYVEEFDRLKNIDAGISFVIEVTLEIGLFFATSGASAATSLNHFRHLTKLSKVINISGALEAGVAAEDVLMVWRVLEGSAEIVSMTAGIASSYLSFLGTIQDDPFKRRLSYFFVAFALASAGGAIFSNRKVIKMADEIILETAPNLLNSLPVNVRNILDQVRGKKLALITDFDTKLQQLDNLSNPNIIHNYYLGLTPDLRTKFLDDFSNLNDINIWDKINNSAVLNNWSSLATRNISERKLLDVIGNQKRVNTMITFYDHPFLRPRLENLTVGKKIDFFDNFHGIDATDFNKFVNDPEKVPEWFKYFDDPDLSENFLNLGKSKQLEFLEDYGNVSQTIFQKFKQKPKLINDWNEISEIVFIRSDINVLIEYRRIKNKPWEVRHIIELIDYPLKFKLTGAHSHQVVQDMFNNGNLKIFNVSDLPSGYQPTTSISINGHIKYENLYVKRPSNINQGGVEIPPGSGVFYKVKSKQYVINQNWSEQRLREEMAYAMANKVEDVTNPIKIELPRHGKTENYITVNWNSEFSDGTPLGLITNNYAMDPVNKVVVYDHLSLLYIK